MCSPRTPGSGVYPRANHGDPCTKKGGHPDQGKGNDAPLPIQARPNLSLESYLLGYGRVEEVDRSRSHLRQYLRSLRHSVVQLDLSSQKKKKNFTIFLLFYYF